MGDGGVAVAKVGLRPGRQRRVLLMHCEGHLHGDVCVCAYVEAANGLSDVREPDLSR